MNFLFSYRGLVDVRINASEKDLHVLNSICTKILQKVYYWCHKKLLENKNILSKRISTNYVRVQRTGDNDIVNNNNNTSFLVLTT